MIGYAMTESHSGNNKIIDFDAGHKVIGALVDTLQNNFREDTHYKRPLMPPQANIIFVLDGDVAENMIAYMSGKLKDVGGFTEDEFRFTRKPSMIAGGLQRVRLEFITGVNSAIIRKVIVATDRLAKALVHNKHN
jgi:hypothetical protein